MLGVQGNFEGKQGICIELKYTSRDYLLVAKEKKKNKQTVIIQWKIGPHHD